ncbi:hypothetical protein FOL47_009472 [Perkinsus chesapeaki]|uniref:Uncharacterized protein n=1 Tax=Perkinsus chesapeaki TaxID=330153 RepID=A0A7J6L856_PERCH|nr:hypothetical protein FOL47_009472 [Perkinsus chesapeaki]
MVRRTELVPDPTDLEIDSMAVDMVEAMKTAHVCVRLALIDARLNTKNKYDQTRSLPDFSGGDLVGLRSPQRQSKLSYRWRGPYVVSDPQNNTVLLKSVLYGPPCPSSRVNVDRLIHLNLSGHLDPTSQAREVPIVSVRAAMDVDGPVAPIPARVGDSHGLSERKTHSSEKQGLEPATTTPAAVGASLSGTDVLDAVPQELDTSRHFVLVDRTLHGDYRPCGTTADDREMVSMVYKARPDQGLSPRRVSELLMDHAGYRRGYIKSIGYHTMSLELDKYGWIQKTHNHLYFVEDLLGEGYVIGEILRESVEKHKYFVEYYTVTRPGGDIICKENYFPPTWHVESEIMFPLSVTTGGQPNGQLRLDRDSLVKLRPYNFDLSDYNHPSPGEFESQL